MIFVYRDLVIGVASFTLGFVLAFIIWYIRDEEERYVCEVGPNIYEPLSIRIDKKQSQKHSRQQAGVNKFSKKAPLPVGYDEFLPIDYSGSSLSSSNGESMESPTSSVVLFFPDPVAPCESFFSSLINLKEQKCPDRKKCPLRHLDQEWTSFMRLFNELSEADYRIDICMHLFDEHHLFTLIKYLHQEEKVEVNLMLDSSAATTTSTNDSVAYRKQLEELSKLGVKLKTTSTQIHHNFAIIDNKKIAMGSLNWTSESIDSSSSSTRTNNARRHDSMIITSQPEVVHSFVNYFLHFWFGPLTRDFFQEVEVNSYLATAKY